MADENAPTNRLADTVKGKAGQFVLTVERDEQFHGCTGFGHEPRPDEYALKTEFRLGVLNSDSVMLGAEGWDVSLDTPEYYGCTDGAMHSELSHRVGKLAVPAGPAIALVQWGTPLDIKNPWNVCFNDRPLMKLEVVAGDDAVEEWFTTARNGEYQDVFRKLCLALGRNNRQLRAEADEKLNSERTELGARLNGLRDQLKLDMARADELGLENTAAVSYWRWVVSLTPYAAAVKKKEV